MSAATWQRFDFLSDNDQDEEDEEEEEDSSESGDTGVLGHQIDEEYIRDAFNLYGLKSKLENFDKAMEMILGMEPPEEDDLIESEVMDLYRDATDLYGLIHARYIISPKGLLQMKEKFLQGRFGHCPRVYCNKQRALPVGLSDELRSHRVRIYCPLCQECFDSRCAGIDGAFFGSSFAAIFLQSYPYLVPLRVPQPFVPKVFGFRIQNKKSLIQLKIDRGEYGWQAAEQYGSASSSSSSSRKPNLLLSGGGNGPSGTPAAAGFPSSPTSEGNTNDLPLQDSGNQDKTRSTLKQPSSPTMLVRGQVDFVKNSGGPQAVVPPSVSGLKL